MSGSTKSEARGQAPRWWQELSANDAAGVSHAFALHGNTIDDVEMIKAEQWRSMAGFLALELAQQFDIIVTIRPRDGITFVDPKYKTRFVSALQLETEGPAAAGNAALRAAIAGGQQRQPQQGGDVQLPTAFSDVSAMINKLLTTPCKIKSEDVKQGVLTTDDKSAGWKALQVSVVIEGGELLLPNADLAATNGPVLDRVLSWGRNPRISASGHLVIMLCESILALHGELRRASSRWYQLEVPMPDEDARRRFIDYTLSRITDVQIERGLDAQMLAGMTGLLNLKQIEDLILIACSEGVLSRAVVRREKDRIVRAEFEDVLTIKEPDFGFDRVGGYQYVKDYMTKRVIRPWYAGRRVPPAMLLSGPAGTGKTQLAEALAFECGVPFVIFDLSKIYGMFVGQTEKAIDRALKALMSLGRCVLFIDEVDQMMKRGGTNSTNGVDDRLFGKFLAFMEQPNRVGKVLIICATNRPALLDPALADRLTERLPVLMPLEDERPAIISTLADSLFQIKVEPAAIVDAGGIVEKTDKLTGRNLRELVANAAALMNDDGIDFIPALRESVRTMRFRNRDQQSMVREALQEMTNFSMLPPVYQEMAAQMFDLGTAGADDTDDDDDDLYSEPERRGPRSRR